MKPTKVSKESVGVKFKGGICAELSLKLWFESDCYFCHMLSQDSFESYCPERESSLSKVTSEAAVCR